MRIAYVTSQFPVPSETFACSDVLQLRKLGHEVFVYGFRPDHVSTKTMVAERGLESLYFINASKKRYFYGVLLAFKYIKLFFNCVFWLIRHQICRPLTLLKALFLLPIFLRIFDDIRKLNPDVVHLFWGHYPSILGFLVKRAMPNVVLSMFLGAHDLKANLNISADIAKRADCIFTHSNANRSYFTKIGIADDRLHVIYRGLDVGGILSKVQGQKKIKGKILAAGRLFKEKGFSDVIRAFADVAKTNSSAHLVVLGDGPERETLKRLAEALGVADRVCFLGHVSHDDVLRHMAEAEVFMLLSQHEAERLPNVIKEAMLCGCTCITTKTPGIDDLVFHDKTGYLVDHRDLSKTSQYIGLGLKSPCTDMLKKSQDHIIRNFDVAISMSRYIDIWQRLDDQFKL